MFFYKSLHIENAKKFKMLPSVLLLLTFNLRRSELCSHSTLAVYG